MLRKVSLLRLNPTWCPAVCVTESVYLVLTLISCRAMCVAESVCPSPAPSPGALQCVLRKVFVLRPNRRAVYVGESVYLSPAPSPGALQCMSRKVSVLHPGTLLRLNF